MISPRISPAPCPLSEAVQRRLEKIKGPGHDRWSVHAFGSR
jgi:hypothetical protein